MQGARAEVGGAMGKFRAVVTLAAVLAVVSGCTAPAETAVDDSTPSATVTPAPTTPIGPEAVELSIEEAATRYLSITCDKNAAVGALADGFTLWENAYAGGTEPDLDEVTGTAAFAFESTYNTVLLFDESAFIWPESARPHIVALRDAHLAEAASYDALANSSSYDEARAVTFPDAATGAEAAEEARLALGIADTSCEGFEGSQILLLAEKAERDDALAP